MLQIPALRTDLPVEFLVPPLTKPLRYRRAKGAFGSRSGDWVPYNVIEGVHIR